MPAEFGSVITAMVTPFDKDGEVDYKKAADLAVYLVEHGSDSLVVSGTTGESPTLSFDEKIELFRTVKEAVGGRAKVIAGTGTNDTAGTVRLTRAAAGIGVDGAMVVVPYYNKPPQEGLYRHFSTVAAAVDLPLILYNVPGRTVVNMTSETVLRLAPIDNIVAIKEASGDLEQIARIVAGAPEGFLVYSGDDGMTLPILAVGGVGVVSVASHVAGPEIKEMIDAFFAGDTAKARAIHLRLMPLFKAMFCTTSPIPVKGAMNLLGHDLGPMRLPLFDLDGKEYETVKNTLSRLGYLS